MISVLYVDDEPVLLDIGKRFLEKSGKLKVDAFLSADIAVRVISPSRYDAVISDYQMPGMDGLDFLSAVREIQPDLPFIVFTGQGGEDIAIQALNRGADLYLQKGGNPKAQYEEIENFIINIVGRESRKDEILAEKRSAEQALSLLQTLYAYAPFGFAFVDRDYVYIHVNDALAGIGSHLRCDLLGRPMEEATPHLWNLIRPLFSKVQTSGQASLNIEMSSDIPAGSGNMRDWLVSLYPVYSKDGELTGFGLLLIDISARKEMEKALVLSEDRYRTLAESAEDIIFIVSREEKLVYINSYGARIITSPADRLVHAPIDGGDPDLSDLIAHEYIREVFATGTGRSYDTALNRPRTRWMEVRLIPLPGAGVDQHQVMGIARDVTDRKNAENGLLNANKKLNLLSSITRHDIINQLSFLFIDLDELRDHLHGDPEGREIFDRVNLAVRTIHHQIEFTREYQEIGIGAPVWQNLHEIVEKSASSLPLGEVSVTEENTGVEILADSLFEKVIYNLMENALRYGDTITTIRCSVVVDPEPVLIIEDDGAGIASSDKKKIFSLGFGKHTGFGLFIAREILSITDMTIKETGIESVGARFEIGIPSSYLRTAPGSSG